MREAFASRPGVAGAARSLAWLTTFVPDDMQRSDLTLLADAINVSERYLLSLAKSMATRVAKSLAPALGGLKDSVALSQRVMAQRIGYQVTSTRKKMSTRLQGLCGPHKT